MIIVNAAIVYNRLTVEEMMEKVWEMVDLKISRSTFNLRLLGNSYFNFSWFSGYEFLKLRVSLRFSNFYSIEAGLNSRIMAKKPKLTESAKQKRFEIAGENINFDESIWEKCIFIDELSFETGPKGEFRVRRPSNIRFNEENLLPVQNSGWSSVMCVTCFSYAGIGPIMRSSGNFNSDKYVYYLENYLIPYAENSFPDMDFYILQDNSRIHTSYETTTYSIQRFGVDRIIPHAPYSPDCNAIENLFGILSRKMKSGHI
jgi:hypothetical protein